MDELTIGQVARQAGVATSAIRYYESIGLLTPPPRISGQRRYPPSVLERLSVIQSARQLGLSIEEIRTLLFGFPDGAPPTERWRTMAEKKLPELEALLKQITALKHQLEAGSACECGDINECLTDGCSDDLPISLIT
jgi:MerR family redox-sensitive transcriptional activator SoxR